MPSSPKLSPAALRPAIRRLAPTFAKLRYSATEAREAAMSQAPEAEVDDNLVDFLVQANDALLEIARLRRAVALMQKGQL